MTGAYGRRERPEPPEPLGAPTVDAHTHLDACGCVDAADVAAALDRAEAVGVTRVVTVADDLASARWVVRGRALGRPGRRRRRPAPHPHRVDHRRRRTPRSSGWPPTLASSRSERPGSTTTGTTPRGTPRSARSAGTSTSPSASASR